jgi:hypothetical protein
VPFESPELAGVYRRVYREAPYFEKPDGGRSTAQGMRRLLALDLS